MLIALWWQKVVNVIECRAVVVNGDVAPPSRDDDRRPCSDINIVPLISPKLDSETCTGHLTLLRIAQKVTFSL